jgi:hypothetical protein
MSEAISSGHAAIILSNAGMDVRFKYLPMNGLPVYSVSIGKDDRHIASFNAISIGDGMVCAVHSCRELGEINPEILDDDVFIER